MSVASKTMPISLFDDEAPTPSEVRIRNQFRAIVRSQWPDILSRLPSVDSPEALAIANELLRRRADFLGLEAPMPLKSLSSEPGTAGRVLVALRWRVFRWTVRIGLESSQSQGSSLSLR